MLQKHSTVPDYGHFHKYLKIDQNQHCLNQSDHSIVDVSNRWYPNQSSWNRQSIESSQVQNGVFGNVANMHGKFIWNWLS